MQRIATDAAAPPGAPWKLGTAILAVVWIGFRPFGDGAAVTGGDLANQIGFLALAIVCFTTLAALPGRVRGALNVPSWWLLMLVLLWSCTQADWPAGAIKSAIFSIIVVLCAVVAVALPRSRDALVSQLGWAALLALLFSYVAVVFFPSAGVHGGNGFEPQHVGLWRGVYSHKNVASYVAGMFAIIGLFVMRRGRPQLGATVAVLAFGMVLMAGSKTVLAVLPAALVVGWIAARFQARFLRALVVIVPVAALTTITLGSALSPVINDVLQDMAPGTTFTGRIDLWRFTAERIGERAWTGFGFEAFWGTPRVTQMEQPIELSWDVRGIVHAHNSFLDLVLALGLFGAIVGFWVILVRPVLDFASVRPGPANEVAQLWMTLWLLAALGASLESFFLRRSDPVWFAMALAIVGLRLCAELSRSRPAR